MLTDGDTWHEWTTTRPCRSIDHKRSEKKVHLPGSISMRKLDREEGQGRAMNAVWMHRSHEQGELHGVRDF